jgi:hypothetical protein
MACSGAHCTNHGTGTTTCASHRGVCSTNRAPALSGEFGSSSGRILASDIDNLRVNIRDELARWDDKYGPYTYYQAAAYIAGSTIIDDSQADELDNMIGQIVGGASDYPQGGNITTGNWINIRDRYNVMRQACICNSDCACNLVCACHNDCGCNYSDERLKENIEFIEVKNGLNVYSWNYIWDKATRHVGVMAQELLGTKHASALKQDANGYYMVDYKQLPI